MVCLTLINPQCAHQSIGAAEAQDFLDDRMDIDVREDNPDDLDKSLPHQVSANLSAGPVPLSKKSEEQLPATTAEEVQDELDEVSDHASFIEEEEEDPEIFGDPTNVETSHIAETTEANPTGSSADQRLHDIPANQEVQTERPASERASGIDDNAAAIVLKMGIVKGFMQSCIKSMKSNRTSVEHVSATNVKINSLRTCIHTMERYHHDQLEICIKDSGILGNGGLMDIISFEGRAGRQFPYDIIADAKALHERWSSRYPDAQLLRDITSKVKTSAAGVVTRSKSLNKNCRRKTYDTPGENGLVNGQWYA